MYEFFYFIILSNVVEARSNVTFSSFIPRVSLILIFWLLLLAIFVDGSDAVRLVLLYFLFKTHLKVV